MKVAFSAVDDDTPIFMEEPSNTGKIEWKDSNDMYIVGIEHSNTRYFCR